MTWRDRGTLYTYIHACMYVFKKHKEDNFAEPSRSRAGGAWSLFWFKRNGSGSSVNARLCLLVSHSVFSNYFHMFSCIGFPHFGMRKLRPGLEGTGPCSHNKLASEWKLKPRPFHCTPHTPPACTSIMSASVGLNKWTRMDACWWLDLASWDPAGEYLSHITHCPSICSLCLLLSLHLSPDFLPLLPPPFLCISSPFLPSSPPTDTLVFPTSRWSHVDGMGEAWVSFKSLEAEYFLMDFYCLDCFARLMKKGSKVPLSQANQWMPSSFCFCFQAGSLQMHPEGHSQVPKIAAGNQSLSGHQPYWRELMNGSAWGRGQGAWATPESPAQ